LTFHNISRANFWELTPGENTEDAGGNLFFRRNLCVTFVISPKRDKGNVLYAFFFKQQVNVEVTTGHWQSKKRIHSCKPDQIVLFLGNDGKVLYVDILSENTL